jgi:hypothetical protein
VADACFELLVVAKPLDDGGTQGKDWDHRENNGKGERSCAHGDVVKKKFPVQNTQQAKEG